MGELDPGLTGKPLSIERRSGLPDRRWRPGVDADLDRLQRQLMRRDQRIHGLEREAVALKKQLELAERTIAALRGVLKHKDEALTSLKQNLTDTHRTSSQIRRDTSDEE